MNFDKRNPSSENNDLNQQPDLEKKKQELEKQRDFKKLSDANNRKKTGLDSRRQLTDLGKEILKSKIVVSEKPDYIEKMSETFTPNNNSENFSEYIASANNIPEDQNNIVAVTRAITYSGKELISKPLGIVRDFFKINDYKDVITGQAEHEGIKNA